MLNYTHYVGSDSYAVHFNKLWIGDLAKDVDGYYYYWRNEQLHGSEPSWLLREIADKLDELNKSWHEEIVQHLRQA